MKSFVWPLAGVVTACLLFVCVMVSGGNVSRDQSNSTQVYNFIECPFRVNVYVSNITGSGLDSEAVVTVTLTSNSTVENVLLRVYSSEASLGYSKGFELSGVPEYWRGNLTAGVSVVFNGRIEVNNTGYGKILVTATAGVSCAADVVGILAHTDGLSVIAPSLQGVLPFLLPPDFNATRLKDLLVPR